MILLCHGLRRNRRVTVECMGGLVDILWNVRVEIVWNVGVEIVWNVGVEIVWNVGVDIVWNVRVGWWRLYGK